MLLQVITGEQNFQTGSTKFHTFFCPTRRHMGKEEHIGKMALGVNPDVPVSVQGKNRFPAMNGAPESLGYWSRATYSVPDGVVLKLFGMKRASIQGQRLKTVCATVFIQVRESGPMHSIGFNLLEHDKSPITRAEIQGRFDILTPREAAQLGISITPQLMPQLGEQNVSRIFSFVTMERQLSSKPQTITATVINSEGQAVAVEKSAIKRAVKL